MSPTESVLSQPTEAFEQYAAGFAGIDGGNPASPIWFCGIEYADRLAMQEARREEAGDEVVSIRLDDPRPRLRHDREFPCLADPPVSGSTEWSLYTGSQYLRKLTRVVLAFHDLSWPADRATLEKTIAARLFAPRGVGLTAHLNLYPVPFRGAGEDSFTAAHAEATGFVNRTLYRAWCMEHRFPFLRGLVQRYQPAVLVCAGSTFAGDFRLAFLERDHLFNSGEAFDLRARGDDASTAKRVALYEAGRTLVAITPFLGRGGLMATDHLEALGHELRRRAIARGLPLSSFSLPS